MTKLEQIKEIEQIFDDLEVDEVTMSDMEVLDVPIINHKTGNTIQHLEAADYADMQKRFLRNGFRSNLGSIKGGGAKEFSNPIHIGCSTAQIGSQGMFEKVGEEMMFKLDLHGVDKAKAYLEKCFKSLTINATQYKKLLDIVGNLA